jgi:lysozyme family protein
VDYAVFDQAVNSGPGRSARWLQQVIGTTVDGGIGPQTLLAAQSADATAVVNGMCDLRLAFLKNLETWDTFGRGWERRINDVREMALSIAGGLPIDLPGLEKADFEILKAGSQGEQVVLLQKRLNKELQDMPGYMPLTENGEYNPETERAVTTFQALHGLEADGIAGHYTLQALGMR